jgi:hypothetical protein
LLIDFCFIVSRILLFSNTKRKKIWAYTLF